MPIARHEHRPLVGSEGKKVVVIRVDGSDGRRAVGIVDNRCGTPEPVDAGVGVCGRDQPAQPRVPERPEKLGQQSRGDDQLAPGRDV